MSALLGRDGRVGLVVAVAGVLVAAALILFGPRGNVLPTAALASNVGALPSLPGTSVSSGSAADLGTPHIPVLGTYHFQTVSQDSGAAIGGTATRTSDRTLTIRQVGVSGSDVSLQYHYGGSLQGDNSDTDIWRTTGIFLSQTSAGPGDCRFSPPLVTTPFPLAVGRTWSSGAACHISFSVGQFSIQIQTSGRVVGTTTVDIGGTKVAAWVLDDHSRYTDSGHFGGVNAASVTDSNSEDLFAPSLGLVVSSRSVTTSVVGGGSKSTSTSTMLLRRVAPDPIG